MTRWSATGQIQFLRPGWRSAIRPFVYKTFAPNGCDAMHFNNATKWLRCNAFFHSNTQAVF